MKNFLILISFLFSCNILLAADPKKEAVEFLTHKTIEDFHKGIEGYNRKSLPVIKRIGKQNYTLVANTTTVRFSLVNYLNDQIFVNDQLVKRSTLGSAVDATTTKIILTALGKLDDRLEEIGMMCFGGCQKNTRAANLKKIIATLDDDHKSCNEQLHAQDDSIKKYPSFRMVSLLHSTFNPEFQSVRNFYLKVAETNKKSVEQFMSKKPGVTKEYGSCIGVMAAGSVADGGMDDLSKGTLATKAGGASGAAIESAVESARSICIKMDELKSCLVNLKKNIGVINSIKRSAKKASGKNYTPEEKLPEIKTIRK